MAPMAFESVDLPQRASDEQRRGILADPGFGVHFTDHMIRATWTTDQGWHDARLTAFGPIPMLPSVTALHYAQEIFEGLKAFRHTDGSVWTFRPDRNAARLRRSARRLALPELPEDDFIASLEALVQADSAWVPEPRGEESLYLRPFMYGAERYLGVRAATEVEYCVIASPAADYFPRGVEPLRVWITKEYSRAGAGGTGDAKCGGNYASSLIAKQEAAAHGADEVMFLDAETHSFIDELSGMNVVVITADGSMLTPALTGSILPGVTRESVLQLGRDRGMNVSEERLRITDVLDGVRSGEITEIFACGTAAVINPIGSLITGDGEWTVAGGGSGEITMALREELTGIQYGRVEDRHGWLHRLA